MLHHIDRFKSQLFFALAFIGLSLTAAHLPTSPSKPGPSSGVECGVDYCRKALPQGAVQTAEAVAAVKAAWGDPVVEDDFDSLTDQWTVYDSPNGNPRRNKENVNVSGGLVSLAGIYGKRHAGAGLANKHNQLYGRWEVRARADKGAGFSPTILLWPERDQWPQGGEIDLLESPRGNRQNAIAVVHNKTFANARSQGLAGSQVDWHTYAVEWLPSRITFYVDDVEQWNLTDKNLIPTTTPMHLVLQNDAGCSWIECPDASTPAVTNMQVDSIKIYDPITN